MTTIIELRNQAKELRSNKQYREALPLYRQCWEAYPDQRTTWDGWGYAFCLSKEGHYQDALDICREVYKMDSTFEPIKSQYAWAIYYTEIKVDKVDNVGKFLKAAQAVIGLVEQADQYAPYTRTVLVVAKYFKDPYRPERILEWLSKLNPEILSAEGYSYKDSDGKHRENASDKEQYYALKAKALLHTQQYQTCIETCNQALGLFQTFHYDNDIWFKKHQAGALFKLGDTDKALSILKELLLQRKEWFIQREIAEIYAATGDKQQALAYAVDAALNFGDIQMKLGLYDQLARLLAEQGKPEQAKKHIELIYQIRTEREWKIDSDMTGLISKYAITPETLPSSKKIFHQLKKIWETVKFENREQFTGKIRTLFPNGKAGFVKAEQGNSYYFKTVSFKGKRNKLAVNQRVSFYLEDGYDRKKNRPSKTAVNIQPV